MKRITIFIVAISLSLQFLNARIMDDGLIWSERILKKDYWSAIFTCKVLDNTVIKTEYNDEFSKLYVENGRYSITVQVEKIFFGKVDTGIVNISSWSIMEPGKTYLIYAKHVNPQGNYLYSLNHTKKVTNDKEIVPELEILSELSNIMNNKFTGKYVMLDAGNRKLAEGFFKNGEQVKRWKHYWPNSGKIKAEYNFSKNSEIQYDGNGIKNTKKITSENKEIFYRYSTENKNQLVDKSITTKKDYGKLVNSFRYYDNGKLQEQYAAKLLGNDKDGYGSDTDMEFKLYHKTGKRKAKGEFLNNDSTGTWYFYDENGKYKEEKIYKDKYTFRSGVNEYFARKEYCTLTGKITDEENKAVVGAKIYLKQNGIEKRSSGTSWGMYDMKIYSSGAYEVEVSYRGLLYKKGIIEIKKGEDRTLDIQVDLSDLKKQSISGRITNKKTGENLVGVWINIKNDKVSISRIKTLEDGTYSIKAIPAGVYQIRARCITGDYIIEDRVIEVKKDEKTELDFQLTPISETSFYGKIIVSGWINLGGIELMQNEKVIARYSGFDGTFYIKDSIPPGVYDARVWMERYKSERIKNIKIIPDSTIVLNVQLNGEIPAGIGSGAWPTYCQELISHAPKEDLEIPEYISGKVTNNIGEEIKYACVDLIKNGETIRRVDTDTNGAYKIEHVREGIYDIQISHAHNKIGLLQNIEVKKGENIIKDVVLERKY